MKNPSEKIDRSAANGFVFLRSYYEAIQSLPDEYRLELLDAVLQYAFQGQIPEELSPLIRCSFTLLVPNIDSSIRRYAANSGNGCKGGRPSKQPREDASSENPTETQLKPNQNPTETQPEPNQNQEKDKEKDTDMEMDTDRDMDTEMETETEMEMESESEKDTGHLPKTGKHARETTHFPIKSVENAAFSADHGEKPVDYPILRGNSSTDLCTSPVKTHLLPTTPAEKSVDIPEPDFSLSPRDAAALQQDAFRQNRELQLKRLRRLPV